MIEQAPHRMQRETPQRRFLRIGIDALVIVLVALNWMATQMVAAALRYPPFFTGRMIGRVYQPFAWWWWQHYWPHNAVQIGRQVIPLERAWTVCEHIVFYPTVALVLAGAIISGLLVKWRGAADLHGSAAWGDATEAREGDLLW
jgi:hypothetical protein